MPTSYTTTVSVTGFIGGYTYGSQLDSLEIISGSTSPYELPQPPSARASFIGLPTYLGVTQTPDWWLGKKVTFTITPQGATGTVTWAGIVQSYSVSPVQTTSTDQIVELNLLGQTSRLSTETLQGELTFGGGVPFWSLLAGSLNNQLAKTSWDEVPIGLTWDGAAGTWDTFTNNKSGLTFVNDTIDGITNLFGQDFTGDDLLTFLTTVWANKYRGWFWFDDTTITLFSGAPTSFTQITSLDATDCITWSSLSANQSFSNIVNNAEIDNGFGVTSSYLDSNSYNSYGNRYQDFGTSWETTTFTPLQVATNKVNAYKQPNKYLQSFTVDLDELTHVTGEWQNFYKSTKPVRLPITNIPAAYGGNHTYLVRGVQLNLTNKHAEATLLVVPSTIYDPS